MAFSEFSYLAAPLAATIAIWLIFVRAIYRKSNSFPVVDVGVFLATTVLIYTCVPLLVALIAGIQLTDLSDNRLRTLAPDEREMGLFFWHYVAFLAGLSVSYASMRRGEFIVPRLSTAGSAIRLSVIFSILGITGFFLALRFATGIDVSPSYSEYVENAQVYASMPLALRQVVGHLGGMLFIAKLALLAIVFQNIRNPAWRFFGVLWIGAELVMPFIQLGSRTNAMLLGMGAVMFYHLHIKPLRGITLFGLALVGLSGFLIQGVLRSTFSPGELQGLDALTVANEFQSVFATGYDIYKMHTEGGLIVPWQIYIGDFLRILPQQLSPITKIDQSEWYLKAIGYAGEGVGFTFGAVAEGVIGFGLPQLFFQGLLLGWVLAKIHNACAKRTDKLLWLVFYIWFCTKIYVSFRSSTFYWLTYVAYDFLPYVVVLNILRFAINGARSSPNLSNNAGARQVVP